MNLIKKFALAIVIIFGCYTGLAQTTQFVTLSATNYQIVNFPVQINQIISVAGYDWAYRPQITGILANGSVVNLTPNLWSGYNASIQLPANITGLTNLTLTAGYSAGPSAWSSFQITTPSAVNVISNYVPADAVVIPASATGNVQIILESSTDLVNWTAASPGTYGASSATNRFFRVRAVHN